MIDKIHETNECTAIRLDYPVWGPLTSQDNLLIVISTFYTGHQNDLLREADQ